MPSADAIVVGGGVVGSAVSYALAREGISSILLERDEIAGHASGAAAGMIHPLGEASGIGTFLTYALRSFALFPELIAELRDRSGVDPEFNPCGALEVATNERSERELKQRVEVFAEHGAEWLDAATLRAELPVAPEARGAFWSPREGCVRSPLLCRALTGAAAQLGAKIETGVGVVGLLREGTRVVGVATPSAEYRGNTVILCMGAWTPVFSTWLGADYSLPIEPVRGQILSLTSPQSGLRSTVTGPGVYLVPRRDGQVVVGATEERVGFDCRVTADGLAQLLAAAAQLLPVLGNCTFRSAWAGLRPATPDRLPVIGAVPGSEGLLLAAGHYRNGVLLAPITARLVADLMLGKELPPDAEPLRPERFLSS